MTEDYRATPKQWDDAEYYGNPDRQPCPISEYACILELRARVEALEAAQQKIRSGPESPLVERVADAIAAQATSAGIVNDRPARAARRPKPPSLKEQALADLDSMSIEPCWINGIDANALVRAKYDNIRLALEALDD
jgi:hypothetical protein